jgi:HEAT repeat protein
MRVIQASLVVMSLSGCGGRPEPNTAARVRHWIETLRKPDAKLRKEAVFKLGNLGLTEPPSVVAALRATLKDADAGVRCEAILALLKCGPAAQDAAGELTDMRRKDRDARVRAYAAKALDRLK